MIGIGDHADGAELLGSLQAATSTLASALHEEAIAELVVGHSRRVVDARAAGLWLLDGGELRCAHASGLGAARPAPPGVRDRSAPSPSAHEPTDALAVPLVRRDATLGILHLEWPTARALAREELTYLELLATHAAEALERARLFVAERRARARVELLYELASALGSAESLEATFEPALGAVCRGLRVGRASLLLRDAAGAMRVRAWRGLSATYRAEIDGHSPWSTESQDPRPILVSDTELDASVLRHRLALANEGIRALAFVPLVHRGALLGSFTVYAGAPRAFSDDDVRLAGSVAVHLAQAVAHGLAEEDARRAREDAARAASAREELLAVVAHDLRTPLGVAQLKAQVMLRRLPGGAELDVMRRDLDAIRRNTARMARLISDLLDVAAIEAGRLSIRPAAHAVGELLAEAAELVRAVAAERGVTLACRAPAVDAVVVCDRQRVLQVLGNLLGNAVRVAPAGGQVAVEAEVEPERISFAVVDDGPGIPAEERETVFFQWSRGARGKAEKKAGVGLGLFIARGVVRAHGGSIWIEPAAPRGTRVAFALPRAAAL